MSIVSKRKLEIQQEKIERLKGLIDIATERREKLRTQIEIQIKAKEKRKREYERAGNSEAAFAHFNYILALRDVLARL